MIQKICDGTIVGFKGWQWYYCCTWYYVLNIFASIHYDDLSRSEPKHAGSLSMLVVSVTVVGVVYAVYTVFGICENAWLDRREPPNQDAAGHHPRPQKTLMQHITARNAHLKRDFLQIHPTNTVELFWTKACIDIQ